MADDRFDPEAELAAIRERMMQPLSRDEELTDGQIADVLRQTIASAG